jgi:2'-hydroxyisoflavone reductase
VADQLKLLIIGGTVFLGRALVEAALARGYEVTLFNRGKSNPDLFPNVEKLHGDRFTDLSALKGHRWDTVIDTCGFTPRAVQASTELLADAVEHYTFVSSLSAYSDFSKPGLDENGPLNVLPEGASPENVTDETYGALKVLCEQAAEKAMPGRVLSIRAGLIVGPHDNIGRFPYWVRRVAKGGEVLAPGRSERPIQIIDVRDLAEWNLRMAEARQAGIYNATGPDYTLTMGGCLDSCKSVSGSDATFTWVSQDFLAEHEVGPFNEMPLWMPESGPEYAGFMFINCAKAIAAGLSFRLLDVTVRDTLAWIRNDTGTDKLGDRMFTINAGMASAREAELLKAWHEREHVL